MTDVPFELDPDRLVLTKVQLRKIIKAMIKRWQKNVRANIKVITAGYAMLAFMETQDDKTIQAIWGDMIKAINHLMMENAVARARGENPLWADVVDKLPSKIEDW